MTVGSVVVVTFLIRAIAWIRFVGFFASRVSLGAHLARKTVVDGALFLTDPLETR
jgi:hypothetical protein